MNYNEAYQAAMMAEATYAAAQNQLARDQQMFQSMGMKGLTIAQADATAVATAAAAFNAALDNLAAAAVSAKI